MEQRIDFRRMQNGDFLYSYEIIRLVEGGTEDGRKNVQVNFDSTGVYQYAQGILEKNCYHASAYNITVKLTSTQMSELLENISMEVFQCEYFTKVNEKTIGEVFESMTLEEFTSIQTESSKRKKFIEDNLLTGKYRIGVFVKPNHLTDAQEPSKSGKSTNFSSTGNKSQGKVHVVDLNLDPQGPKGWRRQINTSTLISIVLKGVKYVNKDRVKDSQI